MATNQNGTVFEKDKMIRDYRLAVRSRAAAVIGRREVLTGKAKFGIFGDGKELPQIAIANAFQMGDWRSGYYRDQTWMFALDLLTLEQFFAQLYGNTDVDVEPHSGGRNMNGHYSSRLLQADGRWRDQTKQYNSAADLAPTGSQMPRAVGLAYASVLYRQQETLSSNTQFSNRGNEVVWVTIGNASTSEGVFWEAVNAIGVLHAPAVITIYDDGYGISVPNQFQMVKENIYAILKGFERIGCPAEQCDRGYDLYSVPAWDYERLNQTYQKAGEIAREYHIPALVHVTEATQPLGHSTSGSHERYKTPERLAWEKDHDCIIRFRTWLVTNQVASEAELDAIQTEETQLVEEARKKAFSLALQPRVAWRDTTINILRKGNLASNPDLQAEIHALAEVPDPILRDSASVLQSFLSETRGRNDPIRKEAQKHFDKLETYQQKRLASCLYSTTPAAPQNIPIIAPEYTQKSPLMQGFEVINAAFDAALARDPRVIAFGEDVGKLGDVNQGFRGLQEKYGALRITDTGIREATILGQAIGMALRGLRPICEIQYLDYLLYALQLMSDDLSTLHWRTAGGQIAPVIIRTRGHRLEGVWHSGSPLGGIIHLVHGMLVLVPRNLVQAAGFYNMLLKTDNPGLVVEVLNGYRLKERLPSNLDQVILPPGIPEILRPGNDVTLVTYGACVRITLEAADQLARVGINAEVIDVQSLLPFDTPEMIRSSLQKTSRIIFIDEDVPGGTTAYMMQQVLEHQNGYRWLDSPPKTISGTAHRPAYTSDGDYWSKPNADQIFRVAYDLMQESNPQKYPAIFHQWEEE